MKNAVMVLGMHRSGTSSLTGCLQQRGLYLGTVCEKNEFNLKGNRENDRIMRLNNSILAFNGGDWRMPPEEVSWEGSHVRERDDIIREYEGCIESIWGFKDPRTLFTFQFWNEGLPEARLIGTFRHPLRVAKSLNFRNKMEFSEGLELWVRYNRKLLKLLDRRNFPLVSFDVPVSKYLDSVELVSAYLSLGKVVSRLEDSFFDDSLRNQDSMGEMEIPIHVTELYSELLDLSESRY